MFRPGKNPKDQTHTDDTADHTPPQQQSSSSYNTSNYASGSSTSAGSSSSGGGSTPASDSYNQSSLNSPAAGRAVTESESLARDIKEGTLTGFVGNGTSLTGEASFKGMLRVDGHLSGRVTSQDGTLIVSTNGQVDANLEVAIAQIYGTVHGDIIATKRIEMGRVSRVTGNIQTPALVIESGAIFEGSCRMAQPKEAADKPPAKDESSSASSASASLASSSSLYSSSKTGASTTPKDTTPKSDTTGVTNAATDIAS
ncbi:MAG: polymer-forming cytoskeletal protein [Acidobacteria bacterium]|nr:polymer-forming cytoskeletal protein [Acidobacteriota bacterium]